MTDPIVDRQVLTPQRRTMALLTARSIMKAYGPSKAMGRVDEAAATRFPHTPGNEQFYALLRTLVEEAIEHGTVGGEALV